MADRTQFSSIEVRKPVHKTLKLCATQRGLSMLDFLAELAELSHRSLFGGPPEGASR